jgi:hypothetical protein
MQQKIIYVYILCHNIAIVYNNILLFYKLYNLVEQYLHYLIFVYTEYLFNNFIYFKKVFKT